MVYFGMEKREVICCIFLILVFTMKNLIIKLTVNFYHVQTYSLNIVYKKIDFLLIYQSIKDTRSTEAKLLPKFENSQNLKTQNLMHLLS